MALPDDIKARLDGQGITGGSTGWEVHFNWMPQSPDKVVLVTESAGLVPDAYSQTDRPQFQIRVRGEEQGTKDARDKMDEVFLDLHALKGTINGTDYGGIWAIQTPSWFRKDQNNRDEFVVNFQTLKARQ